MYEWKARSTIKGASPRMGNETKVINIKEVVKNVKPTEKVMK